MIQEKGGVRLRGRTLAASFALISALIGAAGCGSMAPPSPGANHPEKQTTNQEEQKDPQFAIAAYVTCKHLFNPDKYRGKLLVRNNEGQLPMELDMPPNYINPAQGDPFDQKAISLEMSTGTHQDYNVPKYAIFHGENGKRVSIFAPFPPGVDTHNLENKINKLDLHNPLNKVTIKAKFNPNGFKLKNLKDPETKKPFEFTNPEWIETLNKVAETACAQPANVKAGEWKEPERE
mgnify:CR=1 FL=1